jgi:hypothetical protein
MKFWHSPRRTYLMLGLVLVYSAALYFLFDFSYSELSFQREPLGRGSHPVFNHTLLANFDGYDTWGNLRGRLITNNLGFRDSQVRNVTANRETAKRVVLIGDSFTEGVGSGFDESFAGLLQHAGRMRSDPIEFLNAGVLSYSPVIYHQKTKFLIEAGLQFDELVVFIDISDIHDEATAYFCIDDHPEYRRLCRDEGSARVASPKLADTGGTPVVYQKRLKDHFLVTTQLNEMIAAVTTKSEAQTKQFLTKQYRRAAWTQPNFDVSNYYAPLGIEGGISRALANMQSLADLLRARSIALTVVVYPWSFQLAHDDRASRQARIWKTFCETNCRTFVDLFDVFFAEKDARTNWYEDLFIPRDLHYSTLGHRILYGAVAKHLLRSGNMRHGGQTGPGLDAGRPAGGDEL